MRPSPLLLALATVAAAVQGGAARAETDHLWPRFSIFAGAYEISSTDEIRIEGEIGAGGSKVDVQADLGLPDSKTLVTLGFEWAFAARHSVEVGYFSLDREGSRSTSGEIEVGGIVFPVGASVAASLETTAIEGAYTYWFLRRDNVGVGASLGLVELGADADASATAEFGPGGVTVTESGSASTDLPVPMIGLAVKGSPVERLVLYGRGRVLPEVSIGDYDGEAATYSVGAYYYLLGPLALGASYDGSYYKADLTQTEWSGSAELVYDGWSFFLRAGF